MIILETLSPQSSPILAMDSETGLEESMWQLRLSPRDPPYPERPGEPDCSYYLRNGTCGYGERCRFNHPRDRLQAAGGWRSGDGDYPERPGQAACQYFLKTGTCKYGGSCKYDHPRQGGGSSRPVVLNCYGYPIRQGEKECSYYVRTGQCKFGSTCKFHHPEPAPVHSPGPAFYQAVHAPTMASWQVARPTVLPAPYMQPPYGSMVISSGVVPVQGWSPYPPTVSPTLSPGGQHSVPTGPMFGASNQLSPSTPVFSGSYAAISSAAGPSNSSQQEPPFPERPGQPDCQYYLRTGDCKFGSTCKYHHPPEWRMPRTDCVLSPVGLPLRPGAQHCAYYAQHGVCRFGPTCKFDHHMGVLSYSPSASSLADMPVAPYPVGFSVATLAPSSSSSELRPDFISKDSFSTQFPSTESMPSGSVGSMFSKDGFARPSLARGQMSTPSGSK